MSLWSVELCSLHTDCWDWYTPVTLAVTLAGKSRVQDWLELPETPSQKKGKGRWDGWMNIGFE